MRDFLFFVGGFAACLWFVWGVLAVDRRSSAHRERREVVRPYDHETPLSSETPDRDASVLWTYVLAKEQGDPPGAVPNDGPRLSVIEGGKT